jgi:hypothetical protein
MPKQAVLEGQGASQRLTVRAKYSNGTDRDRNFARCVQQQQ